MDGYGCGKRFSTAIKRNIFPVQGGGKAKKNQRNRKEASLWLVSE